MIKIDKNDSLYKYLSLLGVSDIEKEYLDLANSGRYKRKDVQLYYRSTFTPSQTQDIDENDLMEILDYYSDIKKIKPISQKQVNELLKQYKTKKDNKTLGLIINSQLKDVLYMCVNYKTLHKNVSLPDLIQISNLGLIKAVEKYNENAKISFKDYVTYYVREEILNNFKEKEND